MTFPSVQQVKLTTVDRRSAIRMGIGATLSLLASRVDRCLAADAQEPAENTMHAVRIHAYGGRNVQRYERVPRVEPAPLDVLVRVHAAGFGRVDCNMREGRFSTLGQRLPLTLGVEISGVVERVGEGVSEWEPDDEVIACLSPFGGGGFAEYSLVAEHGLARKPRAMDHTHAAALPYGALAALQALVNFGRVRAGQTVLVHDGAGDIGQFAVQIARVLDAHVIATTAEADLEWVREIGAHESVNRADRAWEQVPRNLDFVFDPLGGESLERSYDLVRPGGWLVSLAREPDLKRVLGRRIRGSRLIVLPQGDQLKDVVRLVENGKLKCRVLRTHTLQEAANTVDPCDPPVTRGKIVLKVR